MRLHEYQSKILLAEYGIPIPLGEIVLTPQAAYEIAYKLGGKVVIRPQVLTDETIGVGDIQLANNPEETFNIATELLGKQNVGHVINKLLVEAFSDFTVQIYLGININATTGMPMITVSSREDVQTDRKVSNIRLSRTFSEQIHPYLGLHAYQGRNLASSINLPYEYWPAFSSIASNLSKCFFACDSILTELNLLALTTDQRLIALSTTMFIDDYALFRHPELLDLTESTEEISQAKSPSIGIHYTKLNGQVACLANGSGLAMATLDALQKYGGDEIQAASIVDIGTETRESNLQSAFDMILSPPDINALFLNLFGVITPCDQIARILLRVLQKTPAILPVIVRLAGKNADSGCEIIRSANSPNVVIVTDLSEAARRAIKAAQGDESWRS